jgi:hypothetical protein
MVYVYAGILLIIVVIIVVTFHLIIIHHNIIIEVSITAIFPRSPRVQVRISFDPHLEGVVRGISSWNKPVVLSLYGV